MVTRKSMSFGLQRSVVIDPMIAMRLTPGNEVADCANHNPASRSVSRILA
jgi:hypothetical protein